MTDPKLDTVRLGAHGPMIERQGYGTMAINTGYYGSTDEAESRTTLEHALELGVTLFDTSDSYGDGANERFLAPFIAAHCDEIVIAAKFGLADRALGIVNDPARIRGFAEASLHRLGVGYIDLYYMHRRDTAVPPRRPSAGWPPWSTPAWWTSWALRGHRRRVARRARGTPDHRGRVGVVAVQPGHRDVCVPAAATLGVALVPYSPLGRGMLTGAMPPAAQLEAGDWRRITPRFADGNDAANFDLLAPLREIAAARGVTIAQVALGWLHGRERVFGLLVVPIPGTRSRARVEENAGGARVHLTDEENARLEHLAPRSLVTGTQT